MEFLDTPPRTESSFDPPQDFHSCARLLRARRDGNARTPARFAFSRATAILEAKKETQLIAKKELRPLSAPTRPTQRVEHGCGFQFTSSRSFASEASFCLAASQLPRPHYYLNRSDRSM